MTPSVAAPGDTNPSDATALTFESVDLESTQVHHIFGISGSLSYIEVIGSRSRSQEQKSLFVYCSRLVCLQLKGNVLHMQL